MANFLITGACGYVGSALAQMLIDKGHSVKSVDVIEPLKPINNVKYIKASIIDKEVISEALQDVDFVYHNAVYVPFFSDKNKMQEINIEGLRTLLQSCLDNSVKKVIITSSSCMFGKNKEMPINNDTKPIPVDFYGNIRLMAEEVALCYANKGLNIITFRPHLIASAGREGIFKIIFEKIINNKNVWLPSSIKFPHQFIHIKDYISALYNVLEYSKSDTFNIGSNTSYTIEQLVIESIKKINSKSKIRIIPKFVLQISELLDKIFKCSILGSHRVLTAEKGFVFDNSYVEEKLNWKPKYSDYDTWFDCFDWFYENNN